MSNSTHEPSPSTRSLDKKNPTCSTLNLQRYSSYRASERLRDWEQRKVGEVKVPKRDVVMFIATWALVTVLGAFALTTLTVYVLDSVT
jgi:hypothetical protein